MNRPKPNEVFTPRRSEVNEDMYIDRRDLERKLRRAVTSTQHVMIFGDSGSGKTWLYKKFFGDQGIRYRTVDLSMAVSEGLPKAFMDALPQAEWQPVRKSNSTDAGAAYVIQAKRGQEVEYEKSPVDPLTAILEDLKADGNQPNFIVFDNFEQISRKEEILSELCSTVIRLDSSNFSSYNIRFLFVGVVFDMKEIIARFDNASTLSNRLTEVPEVKRLEVNEAESLLERGLISKLKIKFYDKDEAFRAILFLTDRNAQQLQEFAYQIACEAEESGWQITEDGFMRALNDWSETSLSQDISHVESRMNKKNTKIQRRNQALYCLGAIEKGVFSASEIDAMIREYFPDKVSAERLGIDQILSSLAEPPNPLLVNNPNENTFRFSHPKIRLAIRARLRDLKETINKPDG